MKPQRKNAGGRKSEQHPNHPQPEPSSVPSAVGGTHQESDSTVCNEHTIILTINLPPNPHPRGISHRQCARANLHFKKKKKKTKNK